ncbi:Uncharacterised protein [Raoultella terrigena]|nr:Uncharacterised protein [Raoultella terrigena]
MVTKLLPINGSQPWKSHREVLCRASAEIRRRRSRVFYQGIAARQRLAQGMHDRGEEFVYADGVIHPRDAVGLSHHLPLPVKLVSVKEKVVKANEVWDLSVRHDQWGARLHGGTLHDGQY